MAEQTVRQRFTRLIQDPWVEAFLLTVIVAVALALRMWGLEHESFSHPENFVPGIDVPSWVRRPPNRTTLEGLLRGTLVDGHPPAYFIILLGWVKVVGTSLLAFRLPSALLGAASVWLVYILGRRERSAALGYLTAAMLALHGFHIYWSQLARMYTPLAFVGLLTSLWLYRAVEDGRRRSYALYFALTVLGLYTQMYAWPLLLAQMVWVAVGVVSGQPRFRAFKTQVMALVVGAPVIQLAIYQNPPTSWRQPMGGFFGFGFLIDESLPFWGPIPWIPNPAVMAALCAFLLGLGIWATAVQKSPAPAAAPPTVPTRLGTRGDWVVAMIVAAAMVVAARLWLYSGRAFFATAFFPVAILLVGIATTWLFPRLSAWRPIRAKWGELLARLPQSAWMAILPVAIVAVVSTVRGIFTARGTIVFLPFLLLLVGHGLLALFANRRLAVKLLGVGSLVGLVILWKASIEYNFQAHASPRDYATLGRDLNKRIQPGDLVLVRNDFFFPPLFYYLDKSLYPQLVYGYYPERVAAAPDARIWLVRLCSQAPLADTPVALKGLHLAETIPAYNGELQLYVREPVAAPVVRSTDRRLGCHSNDPANGPPVVRWHYEPIRPGQVVVSKRDRRAAREAREE